MRWPGWSVTRARALGDRLGVWPGRGGASLRNLRSLRAGRCGGRTGLGRGTTLFSLDIAPFQGPDSVYPAVPAARQPAAAAGLAMQRGRVAGWLLLSHVYRKECTVRSQYMHSRYYSRYVG